MSNNNDHGAYADANPDLHIDIIRDQISAKRTQILILLAETNAFLVDFEQWMGVYQDLTLYQKITLIDSLLSNVHRLRTEIMEALD